MEVVPWSISCDDAFEKWRQNLSEVDWFARVLEPCNRQEFGTQLESWGQAKKYTRNSRWESVCLRASNSMNTCIIDNYGWSTWQDFPLQWRDEIVPKLYEVVRNTHRPIWSERLVEQADLDEADVTVFIDTFSWISGRLARASLFSWMPELPDFYPRCLEILQAGHLPCGWTHRAKQFPEGNFYYI